MNMSPTNYSAANYGGYCPERPRFALVILFLLVLPLLAISGCTVVTKSTVIAPQIQDLFDGKYQVYPAMAKARPVSVAILPFVDVSKSQAGAQAVRRGFYNHFSSLPFRDMELWQVDDRLKKAGLTDPTVINQTDAKDLGNSTGTETPTSGTSSTTSGTSSTGTETSGVTGSFLGAHPSETKPAMKRNLGSTESSSLMQFWASAV